MQRRDFLIDLTRFAALAATIPNDWRVLHHPRFADDPFTLGVAAGDPTPTGAMLWTRLAPKPLEAATKCSTRLVLPMPASPLTTMV